MPNKEIISTFSFKSRYFSVWHECFAFFFHDPPQNFPITLTPLPKFHMQTSHVEFRCFHYFVEDVTSVQKQDVQKYNDEIVLGTHCNRVTLVTVFYITVCCFHFSNACNRLREPSRDILSNYFNRAQNYLKIVLYKDGKTPKR